MRITKNTGEAMSRIREDTMKSRIGLMEFLYKINKVIRKNRNFISFERWGSVLWMRPHLKLSSSLKLSSRAAALLIKTCA
jgi:hypothetical protein